MAAMHHLLLGHGLAIEAMRAVARPEEQLSITLNLWPVLPATDSPEDLAAAHLLDGFMNRLYLDPVLRGTYPEDVVAATTGLTDWSFVQPGDAVRHRRTDRRARDQLLRPASRSVDPASGRDGRTSPRTWASRCCPRAAR